MNDRPQIDPRLITSFNELYSYFFNADWVAGGPPLLAHYTSIAVMEKILEKNEIWFSNPLFMNDLQEVRFGLFEGARLFSDPILLKRAGGSDERTSILQNSFSYFVDKFSNETAVDTYVFCLSEHDKDNDDGLLSMWRGYGQHGSGVALVFDSAKVMQVPESPLLVAKVSYGSNADRLKELQGLLYRWADITANLNVQDDQLYIVAHTAFHVIKTFALTSKHIGFLEEHEWRVIYDSERDTKGLLKPFHGYHIGDRGVEPKLKYTVGHIAGVSAADTALERLLDRIILGPSISSPLTVRSVERMLEKMGKPQFKPLVRASGIPLRPLSGTSF